MKNLLIIFVLLLAAGCNKESEPEPEKYFYEVVTDFDDDCTDKYVSVLGVIYPEGSFSMNARDGFYINGRAFKITLSRDNPTKYDWRNVTITCYKNGKFLQKTTSIGYFKIFVK